MLRSIGIWGDSLLQGVVLDEEIGRYTLLEENCVASLGPKIGATLNNHSKFGCTAPKGMTFLRKAMEAREEFSAAILEFGGNDCDFNWEESRPIPSGNTFPARPFPFSPPAMPHDPPASGPGNHADPYFAAPARRRDGTSPGSPARGWTRIASFRGWATCSAYTAGTSGIPTRSATWPESALRFSSISGTCFCRNGITAGCYAPTASTPTGKATPSWNARFWISPPVI